MSIFRHSMPTSLKGRNLRLSNETFEINSGNLVHKSSTGIVVTKMSVLLRHSTTYLFKMIKTIHNFIHCVNTLPRFSLFLNKKICTLPVRQRMERRSRTVLFVFPSDKISQFSLEQKRLVQDLTFVSLLKCSW